MIPFTESRRYFIYNGVTDMRKSYDGLFGLIQQIMSSNPLSGDVYLFYNRRRNQIRMMVYDRGGLVLLSKRLSKGTFEKLNTELVDQKYLVSYTHLMCIMAGIRLKSLRYRKRFSLCNVEK